MGKMARALNYVVAEIVAHDVRLGEGRVTDLPDIERVASAVELLANRAELEISPFVAAWSTAAEGFDRKAPQLPSFFQNELERALTGHSTRTSVGGKSVTVPQPDARAISDLMLKLLAENQQPESDGLFGKLLGTIVSGLKELLAAPDSDAFDYLLPLLRTNGLTLATLNYDTGVELAAGRAEIPVSLGVEQWAATGTLQFEATALRLLKLHGSLDWFRETTRRPSSMPGHTLAVGSSDRSDYPFLVFGQREKLRASGPFLQLLEEFRTSLLGNDTLIVIGYSFRDPHINEVVDIWLRVSGTGRIVVVDPFFDPQARTWGRDQDFRHVLVRQGHGWAKEGRQRVAFVQESARDFLTRVEAKSLADVVGELFAAGPPATL